MKEGKDLLIVSINQYNQNYLDIKCPYYANSRIRKMASAQFDWERKIWYIERKYINQLEKAFYGELYFKTPLWMIKGEPMPDVSSMYQIDESIVLPKMKLPLYPYQKFGAKFLIDRLQKYNFAIEADGCGLGKTPTALAVVKWACEYKNAKKIIIIGKKSIKSQWADEIRKFTTLEEEGFHIYYTPDSKKKRIQIYDKSFETDKVILITHYENFLNDTEDINKIPFDMAVVDEAHCVKAHNGKKNNNIGKVIRGIPTVFLTGTPVMSRPEDIYGIIQMSNPDYFGSWDKFQEKYLVLEENYGYIYVAGAKNLHKLRKLVQNIVIRRTEYEISIDMPEIIEKNIKLNPDTTQKKIISAIASDESKYQLDYDMCKDTLARQSKLTDTQIKLYEERMESDSVALKAFIAMKQVAANDPSIFFTVDSKKAESYASFIPKSYKMSPKTMTILNEIQEILDNEEKVILFSKFVTTGVYMKNIIERELKTNVLMYTGHENSKIRTQNIKLFRESDEYCVLIGSDAMAEGLNLEMARHIINIDLPDTYAIYVQRIGRARRVSSEYKNVIIHNCLTDSSVDMQKMEKLQSNKDMDGALVDADIAQRNVLSHFSEH